MTLLRRGVYRSFDLRVTEVAGMPLLVGDLIGTENGTFLEIQLFPRDTIVKIAENTTFTLGELSPGGGAAIDLAYGRIRSKIEKFAGREPFSIRGRGTVAGVRGTDFGFDYIVERDGADMVSVAKVYCFEGSVEVLSSGASPRVLDGGEMISFPETAAAEENPPEVKALEPAVAAYWTRNDFRTTPKTAEEIERIYPELPGKLEKEREAAAPPPAPLPAPASEVPETSGPVSLPAAAAGPVPAARDPSPPFMSLPAPEPPAPAAEATAASDFPAGSPGAADVARDSAQETEDISRTGAGSAPEKDFEKDLADSLRELRLERTRTRVGSFGLFAIGAAAFIVGMNADNDFTAGMTLMISGGIMSLTGIGMFGSTFIEDPVR